MANFPDTRTTRLIGNNTELALMASDPECIFCSANHSFWTASANPYNSCEADNQVGNLDQALKVDNKGPPFQLTREPAHLAAWRIPVLLATAEFRRIVEPVAYEKPGRAYASQASASITRAADGALSDASQIGYESATARLKTPCIISWRAYWQRWPTRVR